MIYIAANTSLPLVEWNEAAPCFYVKPSDDTAENVRRHFKGTNVYYVGSWQGCGCGLVYEPEPDDSDDEAINTRNDREMFARYLDEQLMNVPVIELFTCLDGDQHEPARTRSVISPADIREGRFDYEEGSYAEIRHYI